MTLTIPLLVQIPNLLCSQSIPYKIQELINFQDRYWLRTEVWLYFWALPRGHNHLFDLFQIAINNPQDWYVSKLTVDDTKHIDPVEIQREIDSGEISKSFALQEYFTSFDQGQDGFFYTSIIDKMRLNGQIGKVPYEPGYPVITSWDLGINDPTVIIFANICGKSIHIFDYYENHSRSISHFANYVLNKEYTYKAHYPPHDIMVREQGSGLTRR